MIKLHSNESGIALLQALMVTAAVGVAAGFIMSQMRLSETTLVIPRIRSEMLTAESAFRNMAYINQIYTCTTPGDIATCTVNAVIANEYLTSFESYLPNCTSPKPPIPANNACGIRFNTGAGVKFTFAGVVVGPDTFYNLTTIIEYGGNEVSGKSIKVSPITITVTIPEHILLGAPFTCAGAFPTRPFFRGYSANGNPNCTTWPGANSTNGRCNPGFYLKSINRDTMALTCEPLTNPTAACGVGSFIGNIDWSTGGSLEMPCVARPNAFTYFGYTPTAPIWSP